MTKEEYRKYRETEQWKMIRFAVEWVQQGKCALCGQICKPMIIHHNDYARVGGKERPEDLIGLCKQCNARHHMVWRRTAERVFTEGQKELEGVS